MLVEPAPTIPANAIHPPSTQAGLQTNPPQPTSMLPELLSASDDALSQAEPNVSPTPSTPSENGGDRKSLAANANPLLSVNDTQPANMLPELLSVGVNALSPTEPPSANDTQPVLAEPPHATNAEPIGAQPLMELKQHSQHILANAVAQTTTERSLRSEPAEPQPLAGPAVPALPPEPIKPMVAVPPPQQMPNRWQQLKISQHLQISLMSGLLPSIRAIRTAMKKTSLLALNSS